MSKMSSNTQPSFNVMDMAAIAKAFLKVKC